MPINLRRTRQYQLKACLFLLALTKTNKIGMFSESEYCSEDTFQSSYYEKTVQFLKTANPAGVAAISRCLTQKGLHFWLEQTTDPKTFKFKALFVPSRDGVKPPRVKHFPSITAHAKGILGLPMTWWASRAGTFSVAARVTRRL